jgi:hypothetical protein
VLLPDSLYHEQNRRSSAPAVSHHETSPVAAIVELAVVRAGEEINPQEPQQSACTVPSGDAIADLFRLVQTISEAVTLFCADTVRSKRRNLRSVTSRNVFTTDS